MTAMMRNLYALLFLFAVFCSPLFGAEITKVKGSNALVDLKGESASPGDQFYTIGADGNSHAVIVRSAGHREVID